MESGKPNRRIEVWGKVPFVNELLESDYRDGIIKTIWAEIVPQIRSMGNMQKGQAETMLSNVTTKFVVRYHAGKDIDYDNWIMFKGKRHDIKYLLNPFEKNEVFEIFCIEVIE